MNKWSRVLLPVSLALALVLLAAGCGGSKTQPASDKAKKDELGSSQKIPVRKPPSNRDLNLSEMVRIPAGPCKIGGPAEDENTKYSSPVHSVTVKEFWIDKYEVTNKQFMEFCKTTGYRARGNWMDYYQESNNPLMPVLGVSLQDAMEYCKWSGKRLPTNDEWEKAASWDPKTQKNLRYPWGDEWAEKKAHTLETVGDTSGPIEVGMMEGDLSPFGVYDMLGNVFEWTTSRYDKYPGCKFQDKAFGGPYYTVKGGSYAIYGSKIWLATRSTFEGGNLQGQGFRCVSDVAPDKIKRPAYKAPAPEKVKPAEATAAPEEEKKPEPKKPAAKPKARPAKGKKR